MLLYFSTSNFSHSFDIVNFLFLPVELWRGTQNHNFFPIHRFCSPGTNTHLTFQRFLMNFCCHPKPSYKTHFFFFKKKYISRRCIKKWKFASKIECHSYLKFNKKFWLTLIKRIKGALYHHQKRNPFFSWIGFILIMNGWMQGKPYKYPIFLYLIFVYSQKIF